MEFKAVVSSNLLGVAYDEDKQQLFVEFKGGAKYRYDGVDQDEYDNFMSASSKGQYFAQNIKDSYPYERV